MRTCTRVLMAFSVCVWHMQGLGNGVIELANGDEPQCNPIYRRLPFLFSLPVLSSPWEPTSLSLALRQWKVLVAALPVPQGPFPLSVAAVVGGMLF